MPWLVGFVALTIGGERVELARVGSPDPRLRQAATYPSVGVALSAGLALTLPATGGVFAVLTLAPGRGAGHLRCGAQDDPHDGTAQVLRGMYPHRIFLAGAGRHNVAVGRATAGGPGYDLVTHSVFLGFALSMVMGHAPIIFPR